MRDKKAGAPEKPKIRVTSSVDVADTDSVHMSPTTQSSDSIRDASWVLVHKSPYGASPSAA